jgi:hypothetical protein
VLLAVAEVVAFGTLVVALPVDGVLAGLISLMVGFGIASAAWHRRAEPDRACFRIGESPLCDVTTSIADLPSEDALKIVRTTVDGVELWLLPSMRGWVGDPDDPQTFEDLVESGALTADADGRVRVPLSPGEHARIECGELRLEVSPAEGIERPKRAAVFDLRLLAATAMAAVLVGGTIYLAGHFLPESRELPSLEHPSKMPGPTND